MVLTAASAGSQYSLNAMIFWASENPAMEIYLQEICMDDMCNVWVLFKCSGCHNGKNKEEGGGTTVLLI